MTLETLDLSENAAVNSERAAQINALASGILPPSPAEIPSQAVPAVEIHTPEWEPGFAGSVPWQNRISEPLIDPAHARADLRLAIAARATRSTDMAAATAALERADVVVAEVEALAGRDEAAREAVEAAQVAALRRWISSGSVGARPSSPPLAAPAHAADRAAALAARGALAADHAAAVEAHAAAVAAVDRARCQVLTAEAQAIAARYEAALAALGKLQADGRALLGLTVAGMPALAGLVRERLPASLATAGVDAAAGRWAAYAGALVDNADAQLTD